MATVNVDDNIKSIKDRIEALRAETLRLEGSLKVFQELKNAGATWIQLGNQSNVLDTKEVVDTISTGRAEELQTIEEISEENKPNVPC
jgi:lipid II:glycine glycyltransferase (peptidoglycan interpeptide bridge formation enzyme)